MEVKKKTNLNKILELGKHCDKCGKCCAYGAGFLVEEDIPRIADYMGLTEEQLKEKYLETITKFNTTLHRPVSIKNNKPYGRCIFYDDEKGCVIHKVKPLHCKISTCSEHGEEISVWFHLNYFVNPNDPISIRQWKTYLDSGGKNIPGGELNKLVPNKEKLKKILNYDILK